MRRAIIDLGTNTFNLLIANVIDSEIEFVYKAKMPSKLGQDGINDNFIHEDACQRGLKILKEYKKIIDKHNVNTIDAVATSAIRSAKNGKVFVDKIAQETGIEVKIISGENEAELIFKGVKESVLNIKDTYLILDIGGGSTEFILVQNNQIKYLNSFNLGMARLMDKFQPSDPITANEILDIENYLEKALKDFFDEIKAFNVKTLIGSSGSFDTLLSMVSHCFFHPGVFKKNLSSEIDNKHFNHLYNVIIKSNLVERRAIPGMDLVRVEMMVLAMIFTNFIIRKMGINKLMQSRYALKEGLLFSM